MINTAIRGINVLFLLYSCWHTLKNDNGNTRKIWTKKVKSVFYILTTLTLLGCANSTNKEKSSEIIIATPDSETERILKVEEEPIKSDFEPAQIESIDCSGTISDFLKLNDKELQLDFFSNLDSIRKVQYPDNDQDTLIMVDLTPEYLTMFLTDINSNSLMVNNQFEKEYHFDIAPKDYTDPEICKDKIAVSFDDKSCSFRLHIYNTFLVEPDWCTESMVVYGFKIENDKITDFWRQEAG